jgi:hypothetical protein
MKSRIVLLLIVALSLGGCGTLIKRVEKKKKDPQEETLKDAEGDVAFQAFVGRLRKAVAARDMQALASMMTSNFGYRIEPPGEGAGVFQFWDEKGVWQELEMILGEKFVPKGDYMVAPPQFASNPEQYTGYRAGITNVNGAWRFAYFVAD